RSKFSQAVTRPCFCANLCNCRKINPCIEISRIGCLTAQLSASSTSWDGTVASRGSLLPRGFHDDGSAHGFSMHLAVVFELALLLELRAAGQDRGGGKA